MGFIAPRAIAMGRTVFSLADCELFVSWSAGCRLPGAGCRALGAQGVEQARSPAARLFSDRSPGQSPRRPSSQARPGRRWPTRTCRRQSPADKREKERDEEHQADARG